MEKILTRLKVVFSSLNNGVNVPSVRDFKSKKRITDCLQKKILLALVILLFSLLTRPVALDIAEMRESGKESVERNAEKDNEEENIFPFEITKPPDGVDRRLTRAEMRWIFKEELRLNAMKRVINEGNERAHRAYSAMVQDFNIRGANFKYELHDKTRAKEDIEIYREEIVKNAMEEARAYGWGQL